MCLNTVLLRAILVKAALVHFPTTREATATGMGILKKLTVLAAFAALCSSQPVEQKPTLEEAPSTVLFAVVDPPQQLTLPCVTTARAQNVKFSWQKDGKPFKWNTSDVLKRDDEGTIVFLKPKDEDEGRYQCFAVSDSGVASTRIVNVKKAYLTVPKVSTQRHRPIEGQPFMLDCPIPDSYPQPKIEWKLQLETDPSVLNEVGDGRITISPDGTLWFSNITKMDVHDNFKYVCLASSPATTKPVVLAEHFIEGVEPNQGKDYSEVVEQYASQNMTVKVGEVTMLYCIFGGSPLAHPDWFKDGQDVNNSPQDRVTRYNKSKGKRLLIRETWLSDQGTYTCTVDNERGKPKEHSMYLTVVSSPRLRQETSNSSHGEGRASCGHSLFDPRRSPTHCILDIQRTASVQT
ncbi:unnamed protein product [Parnassius apollo]|uniref:(apollo) hypothetical protein n=1 Tax=Parnassius apollo TaxID=110799 RepID=A0A8S3Y7G6_PARAO|nr:unnamed protein product [Parnassius apollo]